VYKKLLLIKVLVLENVTLDIPICNTASLIKKKIISPLNIGGTFGQSNNKTYVRALTDINLIINKGEKVALIGHNGSGKTTLLRLVSRIYIPSKGNIKGEYFQPLINRSFIVNEDNSGFDAIKAYFLLVKKRFKKKEFNKFLKSILEDSGLGDFIYLPIRTYSSGMAERLQFCLMTSFSGYALAIDEVFGTADRAFTELTKLKLDNFISESETLIMASHSQSLLESFCDRGIILNGGKIIFDGEIKKAFKIYNSNIF